MFLIVGANGYLGSYFVKNILGRTNDKILATYIHDKDIIENSRVKLEKCDITSIQDLKKIKNLTKDEKNLKVIFLAAYHRPDLVLQNPKIAWNVNIVALANFLYIMDNIKIMYYPSTEVVYGQSVDDYKFKEDDKLNPVNKYGELKTIAERMINVAGFNVIRFPILIGPSLIQSKKHFFDEIIEKLKNGEKIEMLKDQFRSMIDFDTASKIVIDLMEEPDAQQYKIVNIAGDEKLSKYDLAIKIANKYNLNKDNIIAISIDDNKIFLAKRSKETLLDNSLVKKILGLKELKIKV